MRDLNGIGFVMCTAELGGRTEGLVCKDDVEWDRKDGEWDVGWREDEEG